VKPAELLETIYQYYPRGVIQDDPRCSDAPERRRLEEANQAAGRERPKWLAMLARLKERFAECCIDGHALHLLTPSSRAACYPGILLMPTPNVDHRIGFDVSFLAPCYVLYTQRIYPVEHSLPPVTRLAPDEAERPYWDAIAQEIEHTYNAGYMPPETGHIIVPDVEPGNRQMGDAMIYDCFFDDNPRLVSGENYFALALQQEYAALQRRRGGH
jgi:hypothetical protein